MKEQTQLRALSEELAAEKIRGDTAKAELQAVREASRGFTALAAHDLRSPLQSIVGFAEVLTESWANLSEDDRRKFIGIINRQAHIASTLVDDVIAVSIIEGGGLTVQPEPIVLAEAIDRCLEVGSARTGSVSVSCPPDLVVRVDAEHLRHIMDNLVQNAVKYGEPPVRIKATKARDLVEVRVIDQGPGVPPEFLSQLFGKFARADTPSTRAQKGLGLGLSIVRGLAAANGGQARYEPDSPRGACFVVELPCGEGSQE